MIFNLAKNLTKSKLEIMQEYNFTQKNLKIGHSRTFI